MKKSKFHYGFVIIFSIFLQRFCGGMIVCTPGLFTIPITTSLGLDQGPYMLWMTIQLGFMTLMGVLGPKLLAKFDYLPLARFSVVSMAVGTFLFAVAKNLAMIYVAGAFIGAAMTFMNFQAPAIMIPRWFKTNVNTACGIANLGTTVAGVVLSPFISKALMQTSVLGMESWRGIYIIMGTVVLVVGLLNSFLLLRSKPADGVRYGETDAIADDADGNEIAKEPVKELGVSKEKAIKSPAFVCAFVVIICFCAAAGPVQNLFSAFVTVSDAAKSNPMLPGIANSVVLAACSLTAFILGPVMDKFGVKVSAAISCVFGIVGLSMLLINSNSAAMILAGGVLYGFYYQFGELVTPAITLEYFGSRDYNRIYPMLAATAPVWGAIANPLYASLYDMSGSYSPAFIVCIVLYVITFIAVVIGSKASKKLERTAE